MSFLFNWVIFRFHLVFQGVIIWVPKSSVIYQNHQWFGVDLSILLVAVLFQLPFDISPLFGGENKKMKPPPRLSLGKWCSFWDVTLGNSNWDDGTLNNQPLVNQPPPSQFNILSNHWPAARPLPPHKSWDDPESPNPWPKTPAPRNLKLAQLGVPWKNNQWLRSRAVSEKLGNLL